MSLGIIWAIHTETKPYSVYITCIILNYMMRLMKINIQINKKDDKNEQTKVF